MERLIDKIIEEIEFIQENVGNYNNIELRSVSGDTRLEQDVYDALNSLLAYNIPCIRWV